MLPIVRNVSVASTTSPTDNQKQNNRKAGLDGICAKHVTHKSAPQGQERWLFLDRIRQLFLPLAICKTRSAL